MFDLNFFRSFTDLQKDMKNVAGVEDALSISAAVNLVKDTASEKLRTTTVFPEQLATQAELDSCKQILFNLPF